MIFGLALSTDQPTPGFERCSHSTEVSSHEGFELVVTASLAGLKLCRVITALLEGLDDREDCLMLGACWRLR